MATTGVDADRGVDSAPRRQRRLRRPAGFGLVLLAIVVAMVVIAAYGDLPAGRFLAVAVIAAALLLALRAAEVPPRHHFRAMVLAVVAIVGALVALVTGRGTPGFTGAVMLLLVVLTPVVLATRLLRKPEVTAQSLIGALCVYLMIGIAFELVYAITAELTGTPFFVQTDRPSSVEYQYYSFITLTTVGYGDFSPATALGRMMAITEALAGQVYLVTVVALLVSNYRRHSD